MYHTTLFRYQPPLALHIIIIQDQTRVLEFVNDPSAGSPTETLLRLLLPLNG